MFRHKEYNDVYALHCTNPGDAVNLLAESIIRVRALYGSGKEHLSSGAYFPFMEYKHRVGGLWLRESFNLNPDREHIRVVVDAEKGFAQGLTPLEKEVLKSIGINGG